MPAAITSLNDECDGCLRGKMTRANMPSEGTWSADGVLQLIHSDVCGPMSVPSLNHSYYFITFIDDYSRYCTIYYMRHKNEALQCFSHYRAWAENYHSTPTSTYKIKKLRSDGGGEYLSHEFSRYLAEHGIERQITPPRTPQHNGVAERMNRTLVEGARAMLYSSGLPRYLWAEAINTRCYVLNRSPTRALSSESTPYERWTGAKPDLSHLRVFGCLSYVYVDDTMRTKLAETSHRYAFVGYPPGTKGWKFYSLQTRRFIISRNAKFIENKTLKNIINDPNNNNNNHNNNNNNDNIGNNSNDSEVDNNNVDSQPLQLSDPSSLLPIDIVMDDNHNEHDHNDMLESDNNYNIIDIDDTDDENDENNVADDNNNNGGNNNNNNNNNDNHSPSSSSSSSSSPSVGAAINHRPNRARSQVMFFRDSQHSVRRDRYNDGGGGYFTELVACMSTAAADIEPVSYSDAMKRSDRKLWKAAFDAEILSLHDNKTWSLQPLPRGKKAIGCRWVLKIKRTADGSIDKYKARLVAQGFNQRSGIDYHETFAPVAKFTSIRALLSLAACHDYEVHQMDVVTAYLNGDIDEEIYMRQPDGFVVPGREHLVCKLNKSLYGLKQAGRCWYQKIDKALSDMKFSHLSSDWCVYHYISDDGSVVIWIALYVDDLLIVSNSMSQLSQFKIKLSQLFSMKDLSEAKFILGVEIERDRKQKTLKINQRSYITSIIDRFDMAAANPCATPMDAGCKLSKLQSPQTDQEKTKTSNIPYQSAVGALMYAMLGTRPDICYAVGVLSQYNNCYGETHWLAVKRVLRYLKGTIHYGITYGGAAHQRATIKQSTSVSSSSSSDNAILIGYCDADWGSNIDDRRSITAYVFMIGGGAVSWQSKKQPTVALSTVEAEYMASCQATKEALWWRAFLVGIGLTSFVSSPTLIYSDNQGSIALSKNPEFHQRTKHIDVQHHFVREQVEDRNVRFEHISTINMLADVLTKPLARDQHNKLIQLLGVGPRSSSPTSASSSSSWTNNNNDQQ